MPPKFCKKCSLKKEAEHFSFRKDSLKYHNTCKQCIAEYLFAYRLKNKENKKAKAKIYYQNNKDKIQKNVKEYKQNNKGKIKEKSQEYYRSHKDDILNRSKSYYEDNKESIKAKEHNYRKNNLEKIKAKAAQYYQDNKEHLNEKQKEYYQNNKTRVNKQGARREKIRRTEDPSYKLRKNISKMIRTGLKKLGKFKNSPAWNHLSYSPQELTLHLESLFESWMNWNNHGIYNSLFWDDADPRTWTWHIDHIIPQSKLPYDSLNHPNFKKCWDLSNLRPYSAKQNILDGNKRCY